MKGRNRGEEVKQRVIGGKCEWVRGKMLDAGEALDKILISGMPNLGLQLHPEFRDLANNSQKIRDLRTFVDTFVKWHLISKHPGFRLQPEHNGLFSVATAGAATTEDPCLALGVEVCERMMECFSQ